MKGQILQEIQEIKECLIVKRREIDFYNSQNEYSPLGKKSIIVETQQ